MSSADCRSAAFGCGGSIPSLPTEFDQDWRGTAKDFDFFKEIAGIKATTMVVAGDADIFPPARAVEVFELLGRQARGSDGSGRTNSRLAILPGPTHLRDLQRPRSRARLSLSSTSADTEGLVSRAPPPSIALD